MQGLAGQATDIDIAAREILRIGAVAAVSSIQTNVTIGLVTALVGIAAGPAAVAGFGTAARLEYLLVPMVFGIGGPLVAMVGTIALLSAASLQYWRTRRR